MRKVDHIGIAVADLVAAEHLFSRLVGANAYKEEIVEAADVQVLFLRVGGLKVELLAPLSRSSTVQRFLDNRGQGLHHLAFSVQHIEKACAEMRSDGFLPLSEAPQMGADNKWTYFFHPKTTGGVLIEICQEADTLSPFSKEH